MSGRVRAAALMVLVVSLMAACSTATSVPSPPIPIPTAEPKSTADVAALDAYLTDLLRKDQFSGVALVAQDDRVLLSRGYGLAVRAAGIKNTPDTLFDIGSLTQQFLDVAILMLAQEGKVDLQASVCDFIDDCPAEWELITVHQLMTEWTPQLAVLRSRSDVATVIKAEASSGGSDARWASGCGVRR